MNDDVDDIEDIDVWDVPLTALLAHWDPFAAWLATPIRIEDVQSAIALSALEPTPYNPQNTEHLSADFHIRRIAWLVVHRDTTPISIDIGTPSLGHTPANGVFDFIDGNHRLCAAIIRKDRHIPATFDGECDAFPLLFPQATLRQ
jgi:hypothetical protein